MFDLKDARPVLAGSLVVPTHGGHYLSVAISLTMSLGGELKKAEPSTFCSGGKA
jgi:hypothetical protein